MQQSDKVRMHVHQISLYWNKEYDNSTLLCRPNIGGWWGELLYYTKLQWIKSYVRYKTIKLHDGMEVVKIWRLSLGREQEDLLHWMTWTGRFCERP